jgi:hypothetical protein
MRQDYLIFIHQFLYLALYLAFWDRIDPARIIRMASHYPPNREKCSPEKTMMVNCFMGIFRTGWIETANRPGQRRYDILITTDK